ncbi:hypothetical protein [Saccharopolyspora sp. ASAGF58]|uniref:hypothetical protein n=1 Tax=Saccharopolyspora sp. ASAGF58 TaxID=2719023 RepID=UPI0014402D24|nr:hypothetical protein [Saccharopolyspora sp. ASAGF58]QIZ35636.1 hypothetical protein FDZ84_14230 [Saccharopolyspora sp. ASAGF58]
MPGRAELRQLAARRTDLRQRTTRRTRRPSVTPRRTIRPGQRSVLPGRACLRRRTTQQIVVRLRWLAALQHRGVRPQQLVRLGHQRAVQRLRAYLRRLAARQTTRRPGVVPHRSVRPGRRNAAARRASLRQGTARRTDLRRQATQQAVLHLRRQRTTRWPGFALLRRAIGPRRRDVAARRTGLRREGTQQAVLHLRRQAVLERRRRTAQQTVVRLRRRTVLHLRRRALLERRLRRQAVLERRLRRQAILRRQATQQTVLHLRRQAVLERRLRRRTFSRRRGRERAAETADESGEALRHRFRFRFRFRFERTGRFGRRFRPRRGFIEPAEVSGERHPAARCLRCFGPVGRWRRSAVPALLVLEAIGQLFGSLPERERVRFCCKRSELTPQVQALRTRGGSWPAWRGRSGGRHLTAERAAHRRVRSASSYRATGPLLRVEARWPRRGRRILR